MLQPLMDFSKSWPRSIAVLGVGTLNLSVIGATYKTATGKILFSDLRLGDVYSGAFSLLELSTFLLLAYIVGVLAVYLGERLSSIRETEVDRILREVYVFETGNALLIRRYLGASMTSDIVFALLVSAVFWWILNLTFPADTSSVSGGGGSWQAIFVPLMINLALFVLAVAARTPLEAIDRVLKSHYPEIACKKS